MTFGKQFNMNTVRKLRFSVDVGYAKHGVEKRVVILGPKCISLLFDDDTVPSMKILQPT